MINPFSSRFGRSMRENFERWTMEICEIFESTNSWKFLITFLINPFNPLFRRNMRENLGRWMMEICKFEELENFQILEELVRNVHWWINLWIFEELEGF